MVITRIICVAVSMWNIFRQLVNFIASPVRSHLISHLLMSCLYASDTLRGMRRCTLDASRQANGCNSHLLIPLRDDGERYGGARIHRLVPLLVVSRVRTVPERPRRCHTALVNAGSTHTHNELTTLCRVRASAGLAWAAGGT